ncbi:hypothetical protein P7K49_016716 [Saguinus oedipus]|uniref:Uncharacterized protein n=1 Tax=Saguinus oedipus TaxID=9490 RepID=A0ABQ9VD92_SAGOE|nr:hypothetical protein P7K49_016716 [Saguinus oedipus]
MPENLLHEIILMYVDSDLDDLKGEPDKYVQKYPPGKIKPCEVNVTCLQPLLAVICMDWQTMMVSVIDIIGANTLAYSSTSVVHGGFN